MSVIQQLCQYIKVHNHPVVFIRMQTCYELFLSHPSAKFGMNVGEVKLKFILKTGHYIATHLCFLKFYASCGL